MKSNPVTVFDQIQAPGYGPMVYFVAMFQFVFTYWYELFRSMEIQRSGSVGYIANIGVAMAAGAANQVTTLPLANIQAIAKTRTECRDMSFGQIAQMMFDEGGYATFYKGLPVCVMLSINAAINMTTFDQTKDFLLNYLNRSALAAHLKSGGTDANFKVLVGLSVAQGFFVGMWAKFVAATSCYPLTLTRVKVMSQSSKKKKASTGEGETKGEGQGEEPKILTAFEMAAKVYREDGFAGFYYGLEGQVVNAMLKQGINFMVKERINLFLMAMLMPTEYKAMKARALAAFKK
jgi:hypothetical protein